MILQAVVKNRIKDSSTEIETVTTIFSFGPFKVTVTANLPADRDESTSYVKVELNKFADGWDEWTPPERKDK